MPSGGEAEALSVEDIYAVLGNPIKKRIVEIIAERGAASFTDLKRDLNLSVGTLYYNLDSLRSFVAKDANRKYVLTERGYVLYRAMREGDDAIKRAILPKKGFYKLLDERVLPHFVPQRLMIPLYRNDALSLIVTSSCLLLGLITTMFTRLPLKLLEVEQVPVPRAPRSIGSLALHPEVLLLVDYALSFLLLLVLTQLISRILTSNRPPLLGLTAGLSVAQLPLYAYMLMQWALTGWSYPQVAEQMMVLLALLFRCLQTVGLGLLTAAVSVFFRVSRERGFLVAAVLLYISFFLKNLLP